MVALMRVAIGTFGYASIKLSRVTPKQIDAIDMYSVKSSETCEVHIIVCSGHPNELWNTAGQVSNYK
jgi:hypothetical protein